MVRTYINIFLFIYFSLYFYNLILILINNIKIFKIFNTIKLNNNLAKICKKL